VTLSMIAAVADKKRSYNTYVHGTVTDSRRLGPS
jgi:hypothetical protein